MKETTILGFTFLGGVAGGGFTKNVGCESINELDFIFCYFVFLYVGILTCSHISSG